MISINESLSAIHMPHAQRRIWLPQVRSILLYEPSPLVLARELPTSAPGQPMLDPPSRGQVPLGHRVRLLPSSLPIDYDLVVLDAHSTPPDRAHESFVAADHEPAALTEPLSPRENDILQLLATGASNREIAAALLLSTGTVRWYLSQIYGKLGVKRRTQAIVQAQALRLLSSNT
jgi:DNA-binding CsgD family transcriptional regulator